MAYRLRHLRRLHVIYDDFVGNGEAAQYAQAMAVGAGYSGFALSGPATVYLNQSATAKATIKISDLGGFQGAVTLTPSSLPNGVTASISGSGKSDRNLQSHFSILHRIRPHHHHRCLRLRFLQLHAHPRRRRRQSRQRQRQTSRPLLRFQSQRHLHRRLQILHRRPRRLRQLLLFQASRQASHPRSCRM